MSSSDAVLGDATQRVSKFLDVHLVIQLIDFLAERGLYPEKQLKEAKLQLLLKTYMIGDAADTYEQIHGSESAEIAALEPIARGRLEKILADDALRTIFIDQDAVAQLKQNGEFNRESLGSAHGVSAESIESLYDYAKFQFETANYEAASTYLADYLLLCTDRDRSTAARWGKLASDILREDWTAVSSSLQSVRKNIDEANFGSPSVQVQQRAFLLHWSLFYYFHQTEDIQGFSDMFLDKSDRYIQAAQTLAPHLFRYLAVAVIVKKRRNQLKDLVRLLEAELPYYSDPVTSFVHALLGKVDFEEAHRQLKLCQTVMENDYFLQSIKADFLESARFLLFEKFCSLHSTIDLSLLTSWLEMEQDAAEAWIVNFARSARLDAKIDSKANTIVMVSQEPNIYQQMIDKTKSADLMNRTVQLSNFLRKGLGSGQVAAHQSRSSQPRRAPKEVAVADD